MVFAQSKNCTVGILITDKELILGTIKEDPLQLCSLRRLLLKDHEIINLFICNPTSIVQKIRSYLEQYNLVNANIVFCFSDGCLANTSLAKTSISSARTTRSWNSGLQTESIGMAKFRAVVPGQKESRSLRESIFYGLEYQDIFKNFNLSEQEYSIEIQDLAEILNSLNYIAAIKHEVLMQYKLLASTFLPYKSLAFTTEFMGLYAYYRHNKMILNNAIKGLTLKQIKIVLKNSLRSFIQAKHSITNDSAHFATFVGLNYLINDN